MQPAPRLEGAVYPAIAPPSPFAGVDPFAPAAAPPPPATEAAAPVDAADVEDPVVETVEVRAFWGDTVLRVAHLAEGESFTLGEAEEGERSLSVPGIALGVARIALVTRRAGEVVVLAPPSASLELRARGSAPRSLADLLASGAARHAIEVGGAYAVELSPGARAAIVLAGSEIRFEVARVAAARRVPVGLFASLDPAAHAYTGMSAFLHLALIGSFAFFLPSMSADADEGPDRDQVAAMMHYLASSAENERDARPDESQGDTTAAEGGTGQRGPGESGTAGSPLAQATGGRFAVHGDPNNPDPHLAKERALHDIATEGLIGMLNGDTAGDPKAPVNPWARPDSSGKDPVSALGNMWGDPIEDSFGAGGLDLSGTGEGGGCEHGSCQGIGLGYLNTIGHGNGYKDGQGFGPGGGAGLGHGPLHGGHVAKGPPMPREGTIETNGKLPAEVIQRIVRQNFGRFRMCYETGLRNNPALQGRVAVKFIIDHDGSVSVASDGGSDLPDREVVSCVVRGFSNLTFPQPQGGLVKVVYPLQLVPGQ